MKWTPVVGQINIRFLGTDISIPAYIEIGSYTSYLSHGLVICVWNTGRHSAHNEYLKTLRLLSIRFFWWIRLWIYVPWKSKQFIKNVTAGEKCSFFVDFAMDCVSRSARCSFSETESRRNRHCQAYHLSSAAHEWNAHRTSRKGGESGRHEKSTRRHPSLSPTVG